MACLPLSATGSSPASRQISPPPSRQLPRGFSAARTPSDVPEAISKLKAEPGKDIVQYGFGAVSTLLMQHGLLDELRLWIHPLFVGKGDPEDVLFPKGPETQFQLRDVKCLNSGTLIA